jgi:hypothetical protein
VRSKPALTLLIASIGLLVVTTRVQACSCARVIYPKMSRGKLIRAKVNNALHQSAAVFSGEVVAIASEKADSASFETWVEVKFRVRESWKGEILKEASIWTSVGCCGCNYSFEVGETYLVYAYRIPGGELRTDACTRTEKLTDAQDDRKILGRGYIIPEQKIVRFDRRRSTTRAWSGLAGERSLFGDAWASRSSAR